MKTIVTEGIVLARTNYQEADRILTILTPQHGKVRVMAKGVRRSKSKLAGGIELFSVNELTLVVGRGELYTLASSRLVEYWDGIVKDIDRTLRGYELLKRINRLIEDDAELIYYQVLREGLKALGDYSLPQSAQSLWVTMQLLRAGGYSPNLRTELGGARLSPDKCYTFDFDSMSFKGSDTESEANLPFDANHIKLLRLAYASDSPDVFRHVMQAETRLQECTQLVDTMTTTYVG